MTIARGKCQSMSCSDVLRRQQLLDLEQYVLKDPNTVVYNNFAIGNVRSIVKLINDCWPKDQQSHHKLSTFLERCRLNSFAQFDFENANIENTFFLSCFGLLKDFDLTLLPQGEEFIALKTLMMLSGECFL